MKKSTLHSCGFIDDSSCSLWKVSITKSSHCKPATKTCSRIGEENRKSKMVPFICNANCLQGEREREICFPEPAFLCQETTVSSNLNLTAGLCPRWKQFDRCTFKYWKWITDFQGVSLYLFTFKFYLCSSVRCHTVCSARSHRR